MNNACLCCERNISLERPRICPICSHVFKGKGWDAIDAHWRAKHEDIMPYEMYWNGLCDAHKRLAVKERDHQHGKNANYVNTENTTTEELFSCWRKTKQPEQSWGLAWYLANEFCQRYYSSHGIAPSVIEREGLGYYGIQLEKIRCRVNGQGINTLGRMTMAGNIENWISGSPGDHGLKTAEMCADGVSKEIIVRKAVTYMGIEAVPAQSHLNCRHKRWGDSYKLCFEIATMLALRYGADELRICNHPYHTGDKLNKLDPNCSMNEHPGAFLFIKNDKELLLSADGRLLDGSGDDLWQKYMCGFGVGDLADLVENRIIV